MSTSKRYPRYTPSGAPWLGDVPADWGVLPANALFVDRKGRSTATDQHLTPSQIFGVIPQTEYMERTGKRVVLNLAGADSMRHVEAGDYVSHLRSFQGGFEHATLPGKVSAAYTVLKPRVELNSSYFKYLFKSSAYIQALQTTTDQLRDGQSIRYEQFKLIPLPLPTYAEQSAIACVLDRETTQIDTFIADQEELVDLLAERRSATISHAVTKGLDPDAPMKETGVEWLGAVPHNWDVSGIGRFARVSGGAGFPVELQGVTDEELPVYKVNALGRSDVGGVIRFREDTISRETARHLRATVFPAGTIVLAKVGAALLLGRICTIESAGCLDNNMMGVVTGAQVDSRYARYALHDMEFDIIVNPGAVPSLNVYGFTHFHLGWPPITEQRKIVECLDRETAEIDAAIADAREAIALSRERRAALISAAVTGKIDVRDQARETA